MQRRKTRAVRARDVVIGGGAPVSVQSMTKTHTSDVAATLRQIQELAGLGCEIIRCAVPNRAAVKAFGKVAPASPLPVIADIHFDPTLALEALKAGADGVRVNPCTMSDERKLCEVYKLAGRMGAKVRIGINSGSVRERRGLEVVDSSNSPNIAEAMVSAALRQCEIAEDNGCTSIVLSLKSSDIRETVEAYRSAASACDYPFHLGITAAGLPEESIVKSSIGIGSLLLDGIGDTVRVSMTGPPHDEVSAAYDILAALGMRERSGPEIVSCPTCGRCEIDLKGIVEKVNTCLGREAAGKKVAIMGCVVNGPGEAADADFGIAGGRDFGFLFKKGKKVRKVPAEQLVEALVAEVNSVDLLCDEIQKSK